MCPSKNAPYKEQIGYYNYYCQYFYTEEEEHKVDAWKGMIESVSDLTGFKGFSKVFRSLVYFLLGFKAF